MLYEVINNRLNLSSKEFYNILKNSEFIEEAIKQNVLCGSLIEDKPGHLEQPHMYGVDIRKVFFKINDFVLEDDKVFADVVLSPNKGNPFHSYVVEQILKMHTIPKIYCDVVKGEEKYYPVAFYLAIYKD